MTSTVHRFGRSVPFNSLALQFMIPFCFDGPVPRFAGANCDSSSPSVRRGAKARRRFAVSRLLDRFGKEIAHLLPRPGGTLLKLQACSGLTIITPYKGFRWRPHIRRWQERPGRSIRNAARAACPANGATKIEPGGCDMPRILVFNGTPQAAGSRPVDAGSRSYR